MFWLISLPLQDDSLDGTWRALQKVTGKGDYSQNYRFELPMSLRVGSLDKLMTLSDDLARVDVVVAGVVNKIRRQVGELSPEEPLTVNSRPVSAYLTNFTWDEARYPLRKPLSELVEELNDNVLGVDDDLKAKMTDYSAIKQQYQAANRKTGGSLAVKDLSSIVPKEEVVDTENLMTVIVTVPTYAHKDFLSSYETWCEMIVPRSAKEVARDDEYVLMRVIIFRRMLDDFKTAARMKSCSTREFAAASENEEPNALNAEERTEQLHEQLDEKRGELAAWCRTAFGEAFSSWIHICAVRLFVESVLRYGLPPKFLGALIEPESRHESRLRKGLSECVGTYGAQFYKGDDSGGAATDSDLYPYVSFTLDVEG